MRKFLLHFICFLFILTLLFACSKPHTIKLYSPGDKISENIDFTNYNTDDQNHLFIYQLTITVEENDSLANILSVESYEIKFNDKTYGFGQSLSGELNYGTDYNIIVNDETVDNCSNFTLNANTTYDIKIQFRFDELFSGNTDISFPETSEQNVYIDLEGPEIGLKNE